MALHTPEFAKLINVNIMAAPNNNTMSVFEFAFDLIWANITNAHSCCERTNGEF